MLTRVLGSVVQLIFNVFGVQQKKLLGKLRWEADTICVTLKIWTFLRISNNLIKMLEI